MKISFLVLVVCLCLTAVSAGRKRNPDNRVEEVQQDTIVNDHGMVVEREKKIAKEEYKDTQTYQEGDAIVEEETKTYRTSIQGKRKGKRKVEKFVEAEQQSCKEILAAQEAECVSGCNAEQNCHFDIESEVTCAWKCNCETIIVEQVEEVVEQESELEGSNGEKRKRKVKKEASGAGGKKKKVAGDGKVCSGKKKFSFSNCLLKMKGFAYWGDDAKDTDADWKKITG